MKRLRGKWDAKTLFFSKKIPGFIIVLLLVGIITIVGAFAEDTSANTTPEVKVIDATATMDVSQIGEIPIGQIPDERITISLSLVNTGNEPVSGLRIKTFLVREGREDTISSQLGSDFRDAKLEPGEVKNIKNNYMVSKTLKPGNYKVMVRVDSDATGKGKEVKYIEFVGNQVIKIGAYADAQGASPVYSPSTIETPGSYLIMRDIDGGDRNTILKITASGITIDGGGHVLKGSSSGFTSAIYVDGGSTIKDIHIKNCIFEGVDFGVWFYRVESSSIQNCTFRNCKNIGIRMDQSRLNSISDNTITDNVLGVGLFQSAGNVIVNNYFKNQFNAAANDDQRNTWSNDLQNAQNIAGGQTKGGNAWLDLNGTGFSITTPDTNHDGIAEAPYSINGNNIDYYPLSISAATTSSVSPLVESTSPEPAIVPQQEVSVDTNGNVSQLIEDNETLITSLPVTTPGPDNISDNITFSSGGSADIGILNITAPDETCILKEFPINITIENQGDLDARYFAIYYYISDDPVITTSDTNIGSRIVENIRPHERLEFQDVVNVAHGTGIKSYTIGAILDPANDIYEKNKLNNVLTPNHRIQIKNC